MPPRCEKKSSFGGTLFTTDGRHFESRVPLQAQMLDRMPVGPQDCGARSKYLLRQICAGKATKESVNARAQSLPRHLSPSGRLRWSLGLSVARHAPRSIEKRWNTMIRSAGMKRSAVIASNDTASKQGPAETVLDLVRSWSPSPTSPEGLPAQSTPVEEDNM